MPLFAVQKSGKINLDLTIIGRLSHGVIFAFCKEILRTISSSLESIFFGELFTTQKNIHCVKAFCHRSVDLAAHRRCVSHVSGMWNHASGSTYQSPEYSGGILFCLCLLVLRLHSKGLSWHDFLQNLCVKGLGTFESECKIGS